MKNYDRLLFLIILLLAFPTLTDALPGSAALVVPGEGHEGTALADTSKVIDLDEVVVVAQPKENVRLRQQPLSATMFSHHELATLGVKDLRGLSTVVPSLAVPHYGSRLTSAVYIRGVGSRINSPGVGLYVDGMPYLGKSSYNFHFYGIDRVDVLRGPQGTLYGQNTMGGLVRIYSKNPMTTQGTDIHLGLATYLDRVAEVGHYAKMSDQAALSLTAYYHGNDGHIDNVTTSRKADSSNEAGARLRLLFQPKDNLHFDLTANYDWVKQNAFPYGSYDMGRQDVGDVTTDHQGTYRRNMLNAGLNVRYEQPTWMLTSITGYQWLDDDMVQDIDYSAADKMYLNQRQKQHIISEELVAKDRNSGALHWTAGLFGAYQWLTTRAPVYFHQVMNDNISTYIKNGMVESMSGGDERLKSELSQKISAAIVLDPIPSRFTTPYYNLGVYNQWTYDLTDHLTATLGLRYDHNHVSIDYATSAAACTHVVVDRMSVFGQEVSMDINARTILPLADKMSKDYDELLPKIALSYKLSDGGMLYASVTKGFRAGGYNIQMFSDLMQNKLMAEAKTNRNNGEKVIDYTEADYDKVAHDIYYEPEKSWNFEMGTHLNLSDHAVMVDAAIFYTLIRNQQISRFAGNFGFGRTIVNAGRSRSCGAEIAVNGRAFDNALSWGVCYAITHASFKEYVDSLAEVGRVDYRHNIVPFIPLHTLGAHADYTWELTKTGLLKSICLGMNVRGTGKTYWNEANTMCQPFYTLIGAHVDARFSDVTLSLWARNITNKRYASFAFESPSTMGGYLRAGQVGEPFTMGVDVRIKL